MAGPLSRCRRGGPASVWEASAGSRTPANGPQSLVTLPQGPHPQGHLSASPSVALFAPSLLRCLHPCTCQAPEESMAPVPGTPRSHRAPRRLPGAGEPGPDLHLIAASDKQHRGGKEPQERHRRTTPVGGTGWTHRRRLRGLTLTPGAERDGGASGWSLSDHGASQEVSQASGSLPPQRSPSPALCPCHGPSPGAACGYGDHTAGGTTGRSTQEGGWRGQGGASPPRPLRPVVCPPCGRSTQSSPLPVTCVHTR